MPEFIHLHVHTHYSLLDGASNIKKLITRTKEKGMKAIAISDHGNLFGVPEFVETAQKEGVQPIVACEFYVTRNPVPTPKELLKKDKRYHQILFAKNEIGYKNLMKLSSISFIDGYYYKPRINRELIKKHSEGLIATTCCIASEINQEIIAGNIEEAEDIFRWYLEVFGDDFYVELQHHGLSAQDKCNAVLKDWAKKYNVKCIITNDVHYVDQEDAAAHDILLAIQTNKTVDDKNRFRFTDDKGNLNSNFFLKSPEEMEIVFKGDEEALENTLEIADKCSYVPDFSSKLILPVYDIPENYASMDDYLEALTYERAKKLYGDPLPKKVEERLAHELKIIKKMGFSGYFLIVQDFTSKARDMGVFVGPGRGSAAGSVVAYCLGIIEIDPLQYDLLFERFLNPERVSPPDIDIDFDDRGRDAVIEYTKNKYGRNSVSQIITFGTMGAKTALRDVARAMGVSLETVNKIAKLIPDKPGTTFDKALDPEYNPDGAKELKSYFESHDDKIRDTMRFAKILEGTVRHTGVHAAGIIIAPGDLTDYVPLAKSPRDDAITTQFDGPRAESAGMLKMDFLGLKTLSIIKIALEFVKQRHGIDIKPQDIPLDDKKTFELYQRGDTVATFQFESQGMRRYLRELKPTTIEDLIAMNALYRPGPMDNIPTFIRRKHGKESVKYLHPLLEPILKNTYGIMVYQEQIMQIAQVMAGYSLAEADLLRRAMGKKKKKVMEQEEKRFIERAVNKGIDKKIAQETFDLMKKFASYGFNKSHAAAYSVLAFRTGYLKAHYPVEYMASNLYNWAENSDKVVALITECKRMGIKVLPPDVNKSEANFSVVDDKTIIFGLNAIKEISSSTAEAIVKERNQNGEYKSIFDLAVRTIKHINKKTLENLAKSGALDSLLPEGQKRELFFAEYKDKKVKTVYEKAMEVATIWEREKDAPSLFGTQQRTFVPPPYPTEIPKSSLSRMLQFEKEAVGLYLSAHPLDEFQEMLSLIKPRPVNITKMKDATSPNISIAGVIIEAKERRTKKGTTYGQIVVEDYSGKTKITIFSELYENNKNILKKDRCIVVFGSYSPDRNELRPSDIKDLATYMNSVRQIIIDIRNYKKFEEKNYRQMLEIAKKFSLNGNSGNKNQAKIIFEIKGKEIPTLRLHMKKNVEVKQELLAQLRDYGFNFRLKAI